MSLLTGICLMILVNVELILRSLVVAFGGANRLRPVILPMAAKADDTGRGGTSC